MGKGTVITQYKIVSPIGSNKSFLALAKAKDRSSYTALYAVDPLLEDVREKPRFKAMLKRMNLPE